MNEERQGKRPLAVVAIDIRRCYTSFAYGYCSDGLYFMYRSWGQDHGICTPYTPTSVLCDEDGKLKAFGYDAEITYSRALSDGDMDGDVLHKHCGDEVYVSLAFNLGKIPWPNIRLISSLLFRIAYKFSIYPPWIKFLLYFSRDNICFKRPNSKKTFLRNTWLVDLHL